MSKGTLRQNIPAHLNEIEARELVKPAGISIFLLAAFLIGDGIYQTRVNQIPDDHSSLLGLILFVMNLIFYFSFLENPARYNRIQNPLALVDGIILGFILWMIPDKNIQVVYGAILLIALIFTILWEKQAALIFVFTAIGISLLIGLPENLTRPVVWERASFVLLSVILVESFSRLILTMRARIQRLEIINEFAHQIGMSLEAEQVVNIVNAALQKAIQADSYYIGIYQDKQLSLPLFYDDGEYFSNMRLSADGTLSGWVIENRQSLFMPDLRKEANLEGVRLVVVGQERTSLSWMGVPMITAHMQGVLAVASYRPNAFDRTDMELLENLGQQAALALDNAYHHEQVEKQARLDSLTQVYNHGHFIKRLEQEAQNHIEQTKSMSLIMLDVDYFKQYNDNYGHQAGDLVLIEIARIISENIKQTDIVGRWGGEEFCVLLPNTNGQQARNIAERIQAKVNTMMLTSPDQRQLPFPTISQGIAVYPLETNQVSRLVDLADQRLYIAKERGRNQIEPTPELWQTIPSTPSD